MDTGVTSTIFFAAEWTEYIRGDLVWILVVVLIGVLTLLKRGLEMMFGGARGKTRAAPGRKPGQAPQPAQAPTPRQAPPASPPPRTVFEEMKRYFEILEGRPAKPGGPSSPIRPTTAPAPSRAEPEPEVELDRAFRLPPGGRRVEAVAAEVMTTPGALAGRLSARFEALDSNISISHAELARGSAAALSRQRQLARVRLARDSRNLRVAVLWSEILGRPRHEHPF